MLEENKNETQSGFSVMSTEDLYEINGGEADVESIKTTKSSNRFSSQGPSVTAGYK